MSRFILSNSLKVEVETNSKWLEIKAKAIEYFKSMPIPGIRLIVTTNNNFFRAAWIILMIISVAFGIYNIVLSVNNFYKFETVTNIKRVETMNVTFPAVTLCFLHTYKRDHYRNGTLVGSKEILIKNDNVSRIYNFLDFNSTRLYDNRDLADFRNVSTHLDFFKVFRELDFDCFRFNAATNKSLELFTAKTMDMTYIFILKSMYIEQISVNEYYNYSFNPRSTRLNPDFDIYVGDNYLNSFEKIGFHKAEGNRFNLVEIAKDSVETKLPEPYNQCKEYLTNDHYHQSNCIETCISDEIKNKYSCTFVQSLFAIPGLKDCNFVGELLYKEFLSGCQKQCPESCYSERFTADIVSSELSSELSGQTWFRISLRDLTSLTITQVPKIDEFTFINNIGGGLGLFMGISFPTLIDFIEVIAENLWTAFVD